MIVLRVAPRCHAAQKPLGDRISSAHLRDSAPAPNPEANPSLSQPINCGAITRFATFAAKSSNAQGVARICGGTTFCSRPRMGPMQKYTDGTSTVGIHDMRPQLQSVGREPASNR